MWRNLHRETTFLCKSSTRLGIVDECQERSIVLLIMRYATMELSHGQKPWP
jgi:hypothetical protein